METTDRQGILTKAAAWMQARGWKGKLAKRRGYAQSLLEHGLMEREVVPGFLYIPGTQCDEGAERWHKSR